MFPPREGTRPSMGVAREGANPGEEMFKECVAE